MASRASKKNAKVVLPAAARQPCSGDITIAYIEGILVYFSPIGLYPVAVPSGAAQEVHYPAGTRGDIQAVIFKLFVARQCHDQ